MTIFAKKIKGRKDCPSITIPKAIADQYGLEPGVDVKVTLRDRTKDPSFEIQFIKTLAKAGSQGTLLYIPARIVKRYGSVLKRYTSVWVTIEEAF